jgi:hypothetical protein
MGLLTRSLSNGRLFDIFPFNVGQARDSREDGRNNLEDENSWE